MLLGEDELRWLGLDLRAQWRRRVLVVLTYAIYPMVLWGRWTWIYGFVSLLFFGQCVRTIFGVLMDVSAWGARTFQVLRALAVVAAGGLVTMIWMHGKSKIDMGILAPYMFLWLTTESALAFTKLVDSGYRGWLGRAAKDPVGLGARQQRRLARMGFAVGLEGYSWYEYMQPFRRLTSEQQREIEEMHQAHPRGEWKRKHSYAIFDDERLLHEEQRLRARVQHVLSWVLVLGTFMLSIVLANDQTVDKNSVMFVLWLLAGLVTTLRQAIVLWTEKDPRDFVGEIALVDGAHA